MKVECPRRMNGKGHIRAFSHVQGGVCFKCGGAGHVERKTAPKKQFWFRCWTMIDGDPRQLIEETTMRKSCVLSLQEMRNLPTDLPLWATADGWEDLGRAITDEAEAERQTIGTIGGLVYYPKWATAPYSAIH